MNPIEQASHRSVAELLLAVRNRQMLSQQELADLCGLDRAQLCRYEKGHQEPSLSTLRRMLGALGWSLLLSVEPSTARVDRILDAPFDALDLLDLDVIRLLEVAALAYENGAGIVVDGEVAAVMQGVPVVTGDLAILVRPGDVDLVGRAVAAQHATVGEADAVVEADAVGEGDAVGEAEAGELAMFAGSASARLVPSQVLPASRLARVDFRPWFSGRQVPVTDLDVLYERGALGASAMALVSRMRQRNGH